MALNNYLEDDWDDNSLTGRTGAEKDVFYQYGTGGTGDLLKGVYRPRWDSISGSFTTSGGALQSTSNASVTTPSEATMGSFSMDYQISGSDGDAEEVDLGFMCPSPDVTSLLKPQNGYMIRLYRSSLSNSDFNIAKMVGGTFSKIIDTSATATTDPLTLRADRDSYGNFELFEQGTSQGTGSDTEFSSSGYAIISFLDAPGGSNTDTGTIDNLVFQ